MILSNSHVNAGDLLFDVFAMETVQILSVMPSGCVAKLSNGVTRTYSETGFYRGRRALYWHDPVVVDPPKEIQEWARLKRILQAVVSAY